MTNTKCTKITLSDDEDRAITMAAQKCNLSKARYIKEMALSGQVVNSLPEAKIHSLIAEIYILAEQVEDTMIRRQLKEGADNIWQSLK